MTAISSTVLDSRAQHLLKTLVELYIAEGQPIGSRILSKQSGLDLSSATVRNVMAELEEMGFITSPHTSSGRVPTPRGYRFFVDSLMVLKQLQQGDLQKLEQELHPDHPQRLVNAAAHLLSDLTQYAGLVAMPRKNPVFRQIEFLKLSDKRILLIIVTPEGDVQNRILYSDRGYSQSQLIEAANYINQHFSGLSFDTIRALLRDELKQLREDVTGLMNAAMEIGSEAMGDTGDTLVVSGERNLLHSNDLASNMDSLRRLFAAFEQKTTLLHLLDSSQRAQGVQIYIGGESGVLPLDECSVVTAPYEIDGRLMGTLGVIGPTRMAYERVIPIVDITAKLLSNALSES